MDEDNVQPIEVDEVAMIDYIFDRLVSDGVAVTKDAIAQVMGYEMEYLIEVGVVSTEPPQS